MPADKPRFATPALVLGMSIHGLAVCRALAKAGVPTYALSPEKNAATYTRYAHVDIRPEVNTDRVGELLVDYAYEKGFSQKPVLFPTNDRMVRHIASAWHRLDEHYQLSWQSCIPQILNLQLKDELVGACADAGILHPRSVIIRSESDIESVESAVGYPCIVKPAKPLSRFKVCRIENEADLLDRYPGWLDLLPLVAQEWIAGSDTDLYFYAAFWTKGTEVTSFVGRKIWSEPPAMGQGTALTFSDNAMVREEGRKVAEALHLCGPVAVEFKRQPDGQLNMIEVNVGRTEYCVDLLIQSGVNLPLVEYQLVTSTSPAEVTQKLVPCVWFDTEKDPAAYVREVLKARTPFPYGRAVFPYFGHGDWRPLAVLGLDLVKRASRKFRNIIWKQT